MDVKISDFFFEAKRYPPAKKLGKPCVRQTNVLRDY